MVVILPSSASAVCRTLVSFAGMAGSLRSTGAPAFGILPVSSTASVRASAYTSAVGPSSPHQNGAVPRMSTSRVFRRAPAGAFSGAASSLSCNSLAMPKSMTLTKMSPLGWRISIKFEGLMSRWMTPTSCA
jgi:hypothetical protein